MKRNKKAAYYVLLEVCALENPNTLETPPYLKFNYIAGKGIS